MGLQTIIEELQMYLDIAKCDKMRSDTPKNLKSFLPKKHKNADAVIGPFVVYDLRNKQHEQQ